MNRRMLVRIFVVADSLLFLALVALLAYIWFIKPPAASSPSTAASLDAEPSAVEDTADGTVSIVKAKMPLTEIGAILRDKKSDSAKRAEAMAALRSHATLGNSHGMFLLGLVLTTGVDAEVNLAEAFEWFQKAAEAGNADAMVKMAAYYRDGVWVDANERTSREWLVKAKTAGSHEAAWLLEEEVAP